VDGRVQASKQAFCQMNDEKAKTPKTSKTLEASTKSNKTSSLAHCLSQVPLGVKTRRSRGH
jgi:hypothetical protein